MTSDPKSPNTAPAEGGGMLPALLAGAGILLVAGLFIFGGDDDKATQGKDAKTASANAQTANGRRGGVAARRSDDATETSRPKPKLNPRLANAVVTDNGMAPAPNKKPEPTSFASNADEITYWEDELRSAESMLEIRQRAADYAPAQEARIRDNGSPEDLAEFQTRIEVVNTNLDKAKARVTEIEDKLSGLKGM